MNYLLEMFLSTPPSRVATGIKISGTALRLRFYPRHPRGWRLNALAGIQSLYRFYPRHPRGWRQFVPFLATLDAVFLSTPPSRVATSVHVLYCALHSFLSTPPSRVATNLRITNHEQQQGFYPRHPRGWRLRQPFGYSVPIKFLSTPPSRVATMRMIDADSLESVSIHATLAGGDQSPADTEGTE